METDHAGRMEDDHGAGIEGAPAVILYREVTKDDGRTPHEDTYIRIKILTDEGRKYANIEIPYFKDSGTVHGIRARTVRPDGSVVPFDGRALDQTIRTRSKSLCRRVMK
jgi:hypothetical protein